MPGDKEGKSGKGGGAATPAPGPSQHKDSPEAKREEFRKYLEKTGVLDALTRVLVGLYEEPEKPANPIEYFLDKLATGVPMKEQLLNVNTELTELQDRLREVEEDNVNLRASLGKYEQIKGEDGNEGEMEAEVEGEHDQEPEVLPAPSLQIN